ncbi:MAG: hypothetical protein QXP22_00515 [Candidatus Anstonellales archaeon]
MERAIFCDSSSLISIGEACMLDVFEFFSSRDINFLITDIIENEIVKKPLSIEMKGYQLSALRLKRLIDKKIINVIKTDQKETEEFLSIVNNIFFADGRAIRLVDAGEANIILKAEELGINNILMDERTTRLMIEAPFKISEHFEQELNKEVKINEKNLKQAIRVLNKFNVIRSCEFISIAYENGFFSKYGKDARNFFEAALYKLKYNGCAISFDDISDILKEVAIKV